MIEETYTKQEIAYKLSCSVRTVEEDADYLNLKPRTSPGKPNLYSTSDYKLIKQMRSHCSQRKRDRDTFVPEAIAQIVESEETTTDLVSDLGGKLTNADAIEEGKHYLRNDFFTQSYVKNALSDPFYNLELLERCSAHGWTLTTYQLALIIDKSPRTFTCRNSFNYSGFTIAQIDNGKLGRQYCWRVSK